MNRFAPIRFAIAAFVALASWNTAATAWACSVCQGDPDSKMVKGAESGILLMVLITYSMLLGFAGCATFWFVRARRMRPPPAPPKAPRSSDSSSPDRLTPSEFGTDD